MTSNDATAVIVYKLDEVACKYSFLEYYDKKYLCCACEIEIRSKVNR